MFGREQKQRCYEVVLEGVTKTWLRVLWNIRKTF